MNVIDILDKYIEGKITEGNKMLADGAVDELYSEPERNVHKLLLMFSAKSLSFEILSAPDNIEQATSLMEETTNLSEKYFYALYLLRYQNPITSSFVNAVLERIDSQ